MTQPRPEGPLWIIDETWLRWARGRMLVLRLKAPSLGRAIGASGQAVRDLLAGRSPQSRLLPAINIVLGGDPPLQRTISVEEDALKRRIDKNWSELSDAERKLVGDLVERLVKRR